MLFHLTSDYGAACVRETIDKSLCFARNISVLICLTSVQLLRRIVKVETQ